MLKYSSITLAVTYGLYSSAALAAVSPDDTVTSGEIEVIEVRAQKRVQQLKNVPISVTVVKGQSLLDDSVKDITDLGHYSANLKISQNAAEGTTPTINIRGVGLIDYNTANTSPVGVYVDGNPVGSGNNQIVNLFDIEQVEILKGPQGTLFGRNSTGGAILIRSVRPTFENEGYVNVEVGSDSLTKLQGAANYVLDESLAARVSFAHSKYDYTTTNLDTTSPEAGMEQNHIRIGMKKLWDNAELYVQARYGHWNGIVQPVGNLGIFSNPVSKTLCTPAEIGSTRCYDAFGFNSGSDSFWDVKVNNNSPHHTRSKGLSLEYQWFIDDNSSLTIQSQVSTLDRLHHFNCDGSTARLCEGYLGLDNDYFSNEIRYQRNWDTVFATVGVFQQREQINQDNANDILRDFRGILPATLTATFSYDNQIENSDIALFSQADWSLTDKDIITFGVRVSRESLTYDSRSTLNVLVDPADLNGIWIPFYQVNGDEDDTKVSSKLAWNHTFTQVLSGYYSYSKGTKSGGYNGGFLSSVEQAQLAYYGPESLSAHEIGFKYFAEDGRLNIAGALFYYDYQDQQVFMNQPASDPQQVPLQLLENVGNSEIIGAELESNIKLTSQLSAKVSLGYIPTAKFDEYVDPSGVVLSDKRLPFTSKLNSSAEVEYRLTSMPIRFNIGMDYQSEYYFDQNQSEYAKQDSYTLWRSSVWYDNQQWQVGFWVKNAFNQEYSHLKFDLSNFLGMLEDFKGEGRRMGLSLKYQF